MMSWGWYYPRSLTVAELRERAEKEAAKLTKKGTALNPVCIEGRKIVTSFWGKAWCKNLEAYSDYASRLPRGRKYVLNGCVIDLEIDECEIKAMVSGTELYKVIIRIAPITRMEWNDLKAECAGQIGSMIDLLQGKLSASVMEIMTRRDGGLFPKPSQIRFSCTCPDSASMCKHIAATLYGVGARLDEKPGLLFVLRNADRNELITEAAGSITAAPVGAEAAGDVLAEGDLASVFGIEMDSTEPEPSARVAETPPAKKVTARKTVKTGPQAKAKPKKKPAAKKKTSTSPATRKAKG